MSRPKAAQIRFYIDADILGVGHILAAIRPDVTYPGDAGAIVHKRERPPCPIASPAVKDPVWIPEVARRGWLIITRDRRIQEHPQEIRAVRDNGARMVALTSEGARSVFDQLEVVMCRWRDIERCLTEPAPFIYAPTRTRLRPVPLA